MQPYPQGYNVADYLLEVASDAPVALFQNLARSPRGSTGGGSGNGSAVKGGDDAGAREKGVATLGEKRGGWRALVQRTRYAATFLTQLQVLSGREWKILRR